MVGYIGARAKKRKRNFYLLIFLTLIIFLLFLYTPQLNWEDENLNINENLLPQPNENMNSLASKVEELELLIFQKDQKIKFRDNLINDLKKEIEEIKDNLQKLTITNEDIQLKYNTLREKNLNNTETEKDDLSNLQEQLTKANKKNNESKNKINELKSKNEELLNLKDENEKIKINLQDKNNIFKKEIDIILFEKNKLELLIEELNKRIAEQEEKINKLQDRSHHGG